MDLERSDDDADPQDYEILRVIPHPRYRHPMKYHDIALIELKTNISYSYYTSIGCLDIIKDHEEDKMIAMGWGQTEFAGQSSSHLLQADLEIVNNRKCNQIYRNDKKTIPNGILHELMICAGGKSDTCYVSSGHSMKYHRQVIKYCRKWCILYHSFNTVSSQSKNIPGTAVETGRYRYLGNPFLKLIKK